MNCLIFHTKNNQLILSLEVNGKTYDGITLRVDEKEVAKHGAYGIAEFTIIDSTGEHVLGGIAISLIENTTVAELATSILHEICHQVLWVEFPDMRDNDHHYHIYKAQKKIMGKMARRAKLVGGNPYSVHYRKDIFLNWFWYCILVPSIENHEYVP
jgi:hypothetical protein